MRVLYVCVFVCVVRFSMRLYSIYTVNSQQWHQLIDIP